MREIGGEFWEYGTGNGLVVASGGWSGWGCERRLLASGRTAIDHIISDIRAGHRFRTVYLPSYCCHTMIEPFIANEVTVLFYDVVLGAHGLEIRFDKTVDCDAVLVMRYFGFDTTVVDDITEHFGDRGRIIIEDATHSVFCERPYSVHSSYVFASLRKWMAVPGGAVAANMRTTFSVPQPVVEHADYVALRRKAMNLKSAYMASHSGNKDSYLQLFREAEALLERHYQNLRADELSASILANFDADSLRRKRAANARVILNGISGLSGIRAIFPHIGSRDCPLSVPVIVKNGLRGMLRQHLIRNNVYCPVHWPRSDLHSLSYDTEYLYESELSIVCDQRYDEDDMERVVNAIKSF